MSDSEDDFMSDKFLVDVAPTTQTYSARRSAQELKSLRAGQAKNKRSLREEEAVRRREGLSTSLFEQQQEDADRPAGAGPSKAMDMMKKMGWTVGEGLGKRRSRSPDRREAAYDEAPRGGIGSRSRAEPIRVSMWAGRKGLSARTPSPPPLPGNRNVDYLDPNRVAKLEAEANDYRTQRSGDFASRETDRHAGKARGMLVEFDQDKGVKFHPLHTVPGNPFSLPPPLLRLLYPGQFDAPPRGPASRSPSPPLQAAAAATGGREKVVSAAERVREQMRRDLLSASGASMDDEGEDADVYAKPASEDTTGLGTAAAEDAWAGVNWESMASGTKSVLAMSPEENLRYLVSQLRNEHLFCLWCAFRYKSWDEMTGPGGCPGEEEDDH